VPRQGEIALRPAWPEDTVFRRLVLDVESDSCEHCGATLPSSYLHWRSAPESESGALFVWYPRLAAEMVKSTGCCPVRSGLIGDNYPSPSCCLPPLPQIRTCPIEASGSSRQGFTFPLCYPWPLREPGTEAQSPRRVARPRVHDEALPALPRVPAVQVPRLPRY